MLNTNAKVIALVVTYNRKEMLIECLQSIQKQSFPVDKIIVVNNCSTDGTEALFSNGNQFDQENIILYTTESNLGGSGGFAKGFELSEQYEYDYLWIMDDDVETYPDTLEQLLIAKEALKEEKVGFLASVVFGEDGEPMNVPVVSRKETENGYLDWYQHLDLGLIKIRSATFVSLLFPHEAIKEMGYPIQEYFIWGDDTEYTTRMSQLYGNCYFCGNSKVIHKRKNAKRLVILTEEDEKRVDMYYYLYRNSLLTAKKYNPKGNSALHVCEFHLMALKCLLKPGVKYRWKKFCTMEKAIHSYLFGSQNIKEKLKSIS